MEILEDLQDLSAFQLASIAECGSPDSASSYGAEMLELVYMSVIEELRDLESIGDWDTDRTFEIAEGCINVYTHKLWTAFVDLCAYQEPVSEFASLGYSINIAYDGMEKLAWIALHSINVRLIDALLEIASGGESL